MKKIIFAALFLASYSALANESFLCEYSKAPVNNGVMGTLNILGSAHVEFNGKSFKAFRTDGSYILTPDLTDKKEGMIYLDDKTKIFAASLDKSNFAVSDRIMKTTEQWAKCEIDNKALDQKKEDEEILFVENLTGKKAKYFFMNERHAFTTNCLVWEDVTMITGKYPAMLIGGSVMMGKNPKWDGTEYTFNFNGGSMMARFIPSKKIHKLLIQAGDKFYGCGPSVIDHNYD